MKQSGPRHVAREYALRILYEINVLRDAGVEPLPCVANWWKNEDFLTVNPKSEEYANEIIEGIQKNLSTLDDLIKQHAQNWRLDRMTLIDRNVLRLGAWELIYAPDTPINVILNESVELAKCYGDIDSPKFINGILDPLSREIRSPSP